MMIREKLNKHSKAISSVVILISVACVSLAWTQYRGAGAHHFALAPNYYTTDDSSPAAALAAMFPDDANKMPPFDHDGKPAYRAYVFTADGGGTKWVAYLERMNAKGQQKMADLAAGNIKDSYPGQTQEGVMTSDMEAKKPGDAKWVSESVDSPELKQVQKLTPPDGQSLANVKSVLP